MKLNNPDQFFAGVRKKITGPLSTVQVDVINQVMNHSADWIISWVAYGLATAWHEARLTPQDEWGKGAGHPYAAIGKYGQAQYGRGLVQLTWDSNYEWADKACGLNGVLLGNFEAANDPDIAAQILVLGMSSGHFTGVGLHRFLPTPIGTVAEFTAARRIINGQDRAADIANYAISFQSSLVEGAWS